MATIGVGETLAIVSLLPPAFHAIRLLLDDIESIRNAPSEITKVKEELQGVEGILTILNNKLENSSNEDEAFSELMCTKQVEGAATVCSNACRDFRETLQKWLKHSTEEKINWWDKVKVGFLGAKKVAAFVQQLSTCKATLSLALNTASYLVSSTQIKTNPELLGQKETEVRREGNSFVQETSSALTRLAQISLEDEVEEEIDFGSVRELKQDIKRGRESVQEYKELLATVLVKYEGHRTGVKVTNVRIQKNSHAVVGVQNLDGREKEVQVSVDDLLVDNGSSAIVGVQGSVDFTGFWNKS